MKLNVCPKYLEITKSMTIQNCKTDEKDQMALRYSTLRHCYAELHGECRSVAYLIGRRSLRLAIILSSHHFGSFSLHRHSS
jgi:hypothetical protein